MSDKDKIKEILNPHLGHLSFLLKIKKDEISIDDTEWQAENDTYSDQEIEPETPEETK